MFTKSIKRGFIAGVVIAIALLAVLIGSNADANTSVSGPRDCDAGSAIYCGALSTQELNQKYDANKEGDLPQLFNHFGISKSDIQGLNSKTSVGTVHANGNVYLDGQLIGVNALTAGRTKTANSVKIPNTDAYKRPPMDSFARPETTIKVFIGYENGHPAWGVITSCGNPLTWDRPNVDIEKTVSKKGSNNFGENREVHHGDTVTFRLKVSEASGKLDAHNVKVKDLLPKQLEYVNNSIKIDGNNAPYSTLESIWLRTITKGSSKTVTFDAVAKFHGSKTCGLSKVVNTGEVTADGLKPDSDTASVEIRKKCPDPEKPVYRCDSLVARNLGENRYKFTVSATAIDGAEIVEYEFDFGDGTRDVKTLSREVEHTYSEEGTYTVRVVVYVRANGEVVAVRAVECEKTVTIDPEIEYCEVPGKEHLPIDDPDCFEPEVESEVIVIPNTGPGSTIAGLMAATAAAGTLLYRKYAQY